MGGGEALEFEDIRLRLAATLINLVQIADVEIIANVDYQIICHALG